MSTDPRVALSLGDVDPEPSAVTVGVFDGVHRGHRRIIGRTVDVARERGWRATAVTFDRHPAEVVEPGSRPPYLQPLEDRVASLLGEGLDLVVVLPFTLERSRQSPAEFVEEVLAGAVRARRVVVGANFRFGHRAAGDVSVLADLGREGGFEVEAVPLWEQDGATVSSTAIREHLNEGDVAWVRRALGRPHVVAGPVVRGEGRGRAIGVPTANIDVDEHMLVPASGVYAGAATVEDRSHDCVINVGVRPTFGGRTRTVEAHLLDVDPDLYGRRLSLGFLVRLRDERRFDDVDALVEQIHRDIEEARRRLTDVDERSSGLPGAAG